MIRAALWLLAAISPRTLPVVPEWTLLRRRDRHRAVRAASLMGARRRA